ncbi:hypothetical protein NDU88_005719 [Pleurodeles waltl]|uniref:Uncharacterized protein n=1 Tax=Pleurodeles waltl TaxID=8319 RepID=A0AAV7WZ35_PLEWA|nr:hypothetical protein NDU88_005719 [Pleurodeles waltl]
MLSADAKGKEDMRLLVEAGRLDLLVGGGMQPHPAKRALSSVTAAGLACLLPCNHKEVKKVQCKSEVQGGWVEDMELAYNEDSLEEGEIVEVESEKEEGQREVCSRGAANDSRSNVLQDKSRQRPGTKEKTA